MQCDKKQESRGYLERVLIDGVKPFLFRSRVRTLIGLPEWDGDNRIFSSPSLPVGFTYGRSLPRRDVPFAGAPYSYTRTGEEQVSGGRRSPYGVSGETDLNIFASGKPFPYELGKDVRPRTSQNNKVFEDKTVKNDIFVQETGFSGHRRSEPFENQVITGLTEKYEAAGPATGTAHGPAASLETGRGHPGLNPPSGSSEIFTGNPVRETEENDPAGSTKEGPGAVSDTAMKMETTTIEIPGSSRTRQSAPPPVFVKEMSPTEERSVDDTSQAYLRNDFSRSPELTIEEKNRSLADADSRKKGQAERRWNNTTLRELQLPDNRPAKTDPPPDRYEGPPDQRIERVSFDHFSVEGPNEGRLGALGVKASGDPSDQGRFFEGSAPLSAERLVSRHVVDGEEGGGVHGIGSAHAGALERIEQIHRALREQITRASAEHKRRDEDPMGEQPAMEMPPLQPPNVVITKASSPQAKAPRAFWQRRYLGHFHMRPLR